MYIGFRGPRGENPPYTSKSRFKGTAYGMEFSGTPQPKWTFSGLEEDPYVYFVHSYYLHADDPSVVSSTTEYGVRIDASIQRGKLFATQFHPEKSGRTGLKMLQNFVAQIDTV